MMYRTVGEVAAERYAGKTYDCAIPQLWADRYQELLGHIVWGYPQGSTTGEPWPITAEGEFMLAAIKSRNGWALWDTAKEA